MSSSRRCDLEEIDGPRLSKQAKCFLFSAQEILFFGANMEEYVRQQMRKIMNNSAEYKAIFERKRKAEYPLAAIYDSSSDGDSSLEMVDEEILKKYEPIRQKLGK